MKQKKTKVQFSLEGIMNNPATKRQLEGFVDELVIAKMALKTKQEDIKSLLDDAKNALGIPSKILAGIANEKMNPGSIDQKQHEIEEISDLAEGLGIKE